ncbi:hypothetical protein SCA6_007045 [Theobroma cacao]
MRRTLLKPLYPGSLSRLQSPLLSSPHRNVESPPNPPKLLSNPISISSSRFIFTPSYLPPPEWIEPFFKVSGLASIFPRDLQPSPWVFKVMENSKIRPDVVNYNTMIKGYCNADLAMKLMHGKIGIGYDRMGSIKRRSSNQFCSAARNIHHVMLQILGHASKVARVWKRPSSFNEGGVRLKRLGAPLDSVVIGVGGC